MSRKKIFKKSVVYKIQILELHFGSSRCDVSGWVCACPALTPQFMSAICAERWMRFHVPQFTPLCGLMSQDPLLIRDKLFTGIDLDYNVRVSFYPYKQTMKNEPIWTNALLFLILSTNSIKILHLKRLWTVQNIIFYPFKKKISTYV